MVMTRYIRRAVRSFHIHESYSCILGVTSFFSSRNWYAANNGNVVVYYGTILNEEPVVLYKNALFFKGGYISASEFNFCTEVIGKIKESK